MCLVLTHNEKMLRVGLDGLRSRTLRTEDEVKDFLNEYREPSLLFFLTVWPTPKRIVSIQLDIQTGEHVDIIRRYANTLIPLLKDIYAFECRHYYPFTLRQTVMLCELLAKNTFSHMLLQTGFNHLCLRTSVYHVEENVVEDRQPEHLLLSSLHRFPYLNSVKVLIHHESMFDPLLSSMKQMTVIKPTDERELDIQCDTTVSVPFAVMAAFCRECARGTFSAFTISNRVLVDTVTLSMLCEATIVSPSVHRLSVSYPIQTNEDMVVLERLLRHSSLNMFKGNIHPSLFFRLGKALACSPIKELRLGFYNREYYPTQHQINQLIRGIRNLYRFNELYLGAYYHMQPLFDRVRVYLESKHLYKMCILASARTIPRLGKDSVLRLLHTDILVHLREFLIEPFLLVND